jgi:hypothetical protein
MGEPVHVLNRLAFVGALIVLALIAPTAPAAAATCSNQTISAFGKQTRLRYVLHGHVTCKQAHQTIRAYLRKATPQNCRSLGNICNLQVAGGWTCSLPGSALEAPLVAGCFRGHANVRAYAVPKGPPKVSEFVAPLASGHIGCGLAVSHQLVCEGAPHGSEPLVQVAKLRRDGALTKCTQHAADPGCFQGDFGEGIPSFRPGRTVRMGPFACTVLATAVRCTVARKGFRISPTAVTRVSG